jgi:hypothetical protein
MTKSLMILAAALLLGMILGPSREGFQCGLGMGWKGTLKPGWGPGSCPYCRLTGPCPVCSGRNPAWASKWK